MTFDWLSALFGCSMLLIGFIGGAGTMFYLIVWMARPYYKGKDA